MNIVKQSVQLRWITPNALKVLEISGRVAWKSEERITCGSEKEFVKKILYDLKHESVIEHASASFLIICDRGVSHEIVRHRIASYTQESTRYCNYSKEKFGNAITFIQPPFKSDASITPWIFAMQAAEEKYFRLIALGEPPQFSRSILPNSLKTEIVMTCNFREWRHFLKLRTAKNAHPQMQEIANMIHEILKKEVEIIFDEL